MSTTDKYRAVFQKYFGFLTEQRGFELLKYTEEPRAFDNFVAQLARPGATALRIVRDRGQVFIDISSDSRSWQSMDRLLLQLGFAWDRYPTEGELWRGYEIANQASDLQANLDDLTALAAQADGKDAC